MAQTRNLKPGPVLREKLIRFADLYRGSPDPRLRGNKTACYMAIHPRCKKYTSASPKACEYFNHPIVQKRLQETLDVVSREADITQKRVLQEIARIGLFDPRKLFDNTGAPLPITKLDDDVAAAISGIKVMQTGGGGEGESPGTVIEYKIADKNSALEKLMKYLGAYEKDNTQKLGSLADALIAGINRTKELDE